MIQIIWEFRVRPDKREEFERHYSPAGTWAELFASDGAYKGTQLLRDLNDSCRYITIDRWDDQKSYAAFRDRHGSEYKTLDEQMEELTEAEKKIGEFTVV